MIITTILAAAISAAMPSFEIGINGKILNSDEVQWKTVSQTTTKLSNGGIVETTRFAGRGEWSGLEVEWDRETFGEGLGGTASTASGDGNSTTAGNTTSNTADTASGDGNSTTASNTTSATAGDGNSTTASTTASTAAAGFVRERLRIRSAKPGKFRLTNVDGKCRLIFPKYLIPGTATSAEEIRLATFDKDILPGYDPNRAMDKRPSRNPSGCHMFHPARYSRSLPCEVKGPFLSANIGGKTVLLSYEHASQDNTWMGVGKTSGNDDIADASGISQTVTDDDLWFISLRLEETDGGTLASGSVRRGAYIDGEALPRDSWYETAWYTISFPEGKTDEAIRTYLLTKITDNKGARKPDFYYNTWGMQRSLPGVSRENFTEKTILEEIGRAARLGVETFVFDDGWEENFGVWTASSKRLPGGLEPLIAAVKEKGMTPGIWVGLLACNRNAPIAKQHPEWLIKNPDGSVRIAEWKQCQVDITGGYYDYLLKALKDLTDLGIRFFKWDGINFFSSDLPDLGHGTASDRVKERIDRYNYLLPFRVTSLMRELREYCPDVVVEIDLTEHERALCGLMPLQEGKLFWMNNGTSWYDDYSLHRTKSMRMVASEYASLIPCEALTYAVYPFDINPWHSLQYNLCTGIQSGHGYWGNLSKCTESDYKTVNYYTLNARRVLEKVAGESVMQIGTVGSTPELYVQQKDGYALLTAFSGAPAEFSYTVPAAPEKVLGVIGHAFTSESDGIRLPLQFSFPDDCRAAFVIGNEGAPFRILSSTGWLKALEIRNGKLFIEAGSPTDIAVSLPDGRKTIHLEEGQTAIL